MSQKYMKVERIDHGTVIDHILPAKAFDVNNFKDCSCNNFIYNGKRFSDVKVLKSYTENRYDSGRKKRKPLSLKLYNSRIEYKNHTSSSIENN